jgi:integrase
MGTKLRAGMWRQGTSITVRSTVHGHTKQVVFSSGTLKQNIADGEEWLRERSRLRAGLPRKNTPMDLESAYARFMEMTGYLAPLTNTYYFCRYLTLERYFGKRHSVLFTQDEVDEYLDSRIRQNAVKSGKREIEALKRIVITAGAPAPWSVPNSVSRMASATTTKCRVPTPGEFMRTLNHINDDDVKLATLLVMFLGLRPFEVFRLRWDMLGEVAEIPAEIRKVKVHNTLPIVDMLRRHLKGGEGAVLGISIGRRQQVNREIKKAAEAAGVVPWGGLRAVRGLLCSIAEERFPADTVALVTTHKRTSEVCTYTRTAAYGLIERKDEVLRYVEERLVAVSSQTIRQQPS